MSYLIDEEEFKELCKEYSVVPVIKQRILKENVLDICKGITANYQLLLHSPRGARYSFYAVNSTHMYIGSDSKLEVIDVCSGTSETYVGNPLNALEKQFMQYKAPTIKNVPPFYGGLVGYISYDAMRYIENIPNDTIDDLGLPLLFFSMVCDGIAIDHEQQELFIFANKVKDESYSDVMKRIESIEEQLERMEIAEQLERMELAKQVERINSTTYQSIDRRIVSSFSEKQFCQAVDTIIDYIKAGDVFQVNLSLRQGIKTNKDPFDVYCKLVEKNPSPYMAYIKTPTFSIVSSSPELLVKVKDQVVETRPIAGTRSRGKTEAEEQALMDDLMTNEKEVAEHIMLVDLERNDLGRVSEYGSVEVNELLVLEKYSHVIHLVSNVRGRLQTDKNIFDVIKAVFPGGTITGAPKVRTMEIIEELEPVKRGLYTGSIGWLGFQHEMELNIVIRTAIFTNGWAFVQAGAGIVYDSIPRREYKESLKKARALWDILLEES